MADALPTRPGFYLDRLGMVWQLQRDGDWEYMGRQGAEPMSVVLDPFRAGELGAAMLLVWESETRDARVLPLTPMEAKRPEIPRRNP